MLLLFPSISPIIFLIHPWLGFKDIIFVSVDAVYAMAHAVHAMILQKCTRDSKPGLLHFCKKVKPAPSGRELLKYIREVNLQVTGLSYFCSWNRDT